ncbi:MAG: hypothetical protein MUF43_13230 [Flavobacterium sp.]|jgi:hypothetical protein|nr:hypothetical protein [Flavobacterium sp.]
MNWKELKDFCNSLTEEQLQQKVAMWLDDEEVTDIDAITLSQEYYIDNEGCFETYLRLEDVKEIIKDDAITYPNGLDDFKKVYKTGDPILLDN